MTPTVVLCQWFLDWFTSENIEEELEEEAQFWFLVVKTLFKRFVLRVEGHEIPRGVYEALNNINIVLNPFTDYYRPPPSRLCDQMEKDTHAKAKAFVTRFTMLVSAVISHKIDVPMDERQQLNRIEMEEMFLEWAIFFRHARYPRDSMRGLVSDIIFVETPRLYEAERAGDEEAALLRKIYRNLVYAFHGVWITEEIILNVLVSAPSPPESEDEQDDDDEDEEEAPPVIA